MRRPIVSVSWPAAAYAVYAAFTLAYLLWGTELAYFTQWCFFVRLLMLIAPLVALRDYPLSVVSLSMTFCAGVGITVVVLQGSVLMDLADEEYGTTQAWTGNVLLHYVPLIADPLYVWYNAAWPRAGNIVVTGVITVYAISTLYLTLMAPREKYLLTIPAGISMAGITPVPPLICLVVAYWRKRFE